MSKYIEPPMHVSFVKNICHPMTKWEIIVILLESIEELHILNAT